MWVTDGERSEQEGGSLLHVTLQQEHDGRVALCCLFELVQRDLVVVVLIHFAENLVHPLLWCQTILVHLHHDHSAHHFVDSLWERHSEKLAEDCLLCKPMKPTCVHLFMKINDFQPGVLLQLPRSMWRAHLIRNRNCDLFKIFNIFHIFV